MFQNGAFFHDQVEQEDHKSCFDYGPLAGCQVRILPERFAEQVVNQGLPEVSLVQRVHDCTGYLVGEIIQVFGNDFAFAFSVSVGVDCLRKRYPLCGPFSPYGR